MKKTLKRCLSLFLTLILLFTLAGNAFAATRDNVRQYKEYTCLGDSIATGLNYEHLDASTTFEETPGSYHSIIKQAACAKLHQYAFSGNSTKETRYIFEPDYELDEYCFWDIVGVTAEQIDGMRADIIESVRNSELITINLGSNDIFTYAMRAAFPEEETAEETNSAAAEETWEEAETTQAAPEETGTIALADESGMIAAADEEEIASEGVIFAAGAEDDFSEEAGITYEVKDEVTAETTDASSAGSLLTLLAKLIEGGRILQENYRQIIKDIRAINPDATIVIVGMYNPFRHVKFSPDSVFTGDAMGRMVVDPVNLFLYSLANSYSNVYYADVTETETYYDIKDITMSDEEFMTYMIIDTHPTPDGHQYMADQILKVLPERTQPLVHDWMDPTYEWAEDLSSVTATRVCRNSDSHVETETAMTTAEVTKEASCEEAEETTYTAVFENEGFETQTQTVETGEPIGHVWGEPVWTWADDCSAASAAFVCTRDETHEETVEAAITSKATADGRIVYTATAEFEGKTYTDEKEDDILLSENELTIVAGQTGELSVLSGKGAAVTNVEWSTSRDDVADADASGVVTAKKAGKAAITASVDDFFADCSVQVLFTDVTDPGLFYYDYIYDMVDKDVVGGFDDGSFRPLGDCNRAAIVTFLWRFAGRPEPESVATFKDMTGKSDFDKAISWAAENELTTGWDDNTFRPWNTCNRLAIVSFLARYDALETK